ncbi:hypothetical protein [Sporomusa termitida]|uniref:Uncharacterized protein n=1 Tax=Sporomusa termitida TaxID=2377 RepID=A0A517DWV4_9FIRM|nr:hypothetical protein [Sporomusa termitida]QDR81827.1 hypothetical protein SPTER_32430 [Sporomusa termitida]
MLGPDGNPYIVPYTFDFEAFIEKYKSLAIPPSTEGYMEYTYTVLINAFRTGAIDDLQRSYDGTYGYFNPAFMSFTASASFVYGVASNLMWLDIDSCLWGGGKLNQIQSWLPGATNDISGEKYNNPNNPPQIRHGYKFVDSLRSHAELSGSPMTSDSALTNYSNSFNIETNIAKELATNRSNALSLTTYNQKWQDNFQTMLGPANPLFVNAEKGIPNKYGVLIEVDDFGNPTYEGLIRTTDQEEFINRVTEKSVLDYLQVAWNGYLQAEDSARML